ncbi:MAG: recombinase family protein [Hyphomicrobiaceae bacterium]
MAAFIAYLRVSTARQGQSGLGLDAQRSIIDGFARSCGARIDATFVEVESGKNSDRPELAKALGRCKAIGGTLVVARLDRLARDLAFIAKMLRDGVEFTACDAPYANRLTLGILAAVAEDEGRRISERTRKALEIARQRGTRLGGYKGYNPTDGDRKRAATALKAQADQRADALRPVLDELREEGISTTIDLAAALNQRAIPTARGGKWHAASVARLVARLAA